MFAQLEPVANTREHAAANGATARAAPNVADRAAPLSAPLTAGPPLDAPASSATLAAEEARANSAPWPAWSAWSTGDEAPDGDDVAAPTAVHNGASVASADTVTGASVDAPTDVGEPTPAPQASSATADAPGVTTLEALERGFAASGFEQFTAQPGALATLASQASHGEGLETPTAPRLARVDAPASVPPASQNAETREMDDGAGATVDWPPTPSASDAFADAAPSDEPVVEAPTVPSGPDPKDYAARLDLARRKRGEGALDDAFVEYTAVLRNAPDLLPEVMRDLEDLSAEESAHPEAHRLLGDARIRQGDYMSALASLNRATALTQAQDQEDEE
jgi:hypothetical protein